KDTVISILDGNGEPTNLDSEDYVTKDISGRHVTLTIKNEPGKPLPNTGGSGAQLLTSAGAAMIAGSLLVYGYRKRLRGKEGRSK
ncbi:LPXTG cell wall anchor domain-containing protein, partial [Faecalibaculum rodentium]